jgi:hypothetical protein
MFPVILARCTGRHSTCRTGRKLLPSAAWRILPVDFAAFPFYAAFWPSFLIKQVKKNTLRHAHETAYC